MNWAQFKHPVSYMCPAGTVVAPWSLIQEVIGSSPFNDNYLLLMKSLNSVKTFRKNSIVWIPARLVQAKSDDDNVHQRNSDFTHNFEIHCFCETLD